MIKLIPPGSQDLGDPSPRRVKLARQGMGPADRHAFLKYASPDFLDDLEKLRPGEVPLHLYALGATEFSGSNRNGDGFNEHWCMRNHDTFVKGAHWFENHKNKADDLRYGRVVSSAYNTDMKRIELLVGVFETKEAAERDHPTLGRVDHQTLEKLASGEPISVSMACLIDHDVCDHCGNKAKHRGEYCDDHAIKLASGRLIPACSGFGCRRGLTKVAADGRVQFVDNPDPRWFDISRVPKNADRLAFVLGRLEKAASAVVMGGAELAERAGLAEAPPAGNAKLARARLELNELARLRHVPAPSGFDYALAKQALAVDAVSARDRPAALRALADAEVLLGVGDWLALAAGKRAALEIEEDVASRVAGTVDRLQNEEALATALAVDASSPAPHAPPIKWARWAHELVAAYSIAPGPIERRVVTNLTRAIPPATLRVKHAASAHPASDALADQYAIYAIAFLADRPVDDPALPRARHLVARRLMTS